LLVARLQINRGHGQIGENQTDGIDRMGTSTESNSGTIEIIVELETGCPKIVQ
jgi:hypothetical protein